MVATKFLSMQKVLSIFFLIFLMNSLFGQIGFDKSNQLIRNKKIRSTVSVGISDMNADYKDDLIFLDKGQDLIVAHQNGPDSEFDLIESGKILEYPAWALSLGDLDNDGVNEIFTCGINTYGNIFKLNQMGNYANTQLLFGLTFPQNSNMADINNDGWLDVFVCDERAYNDIYLNDQSGYLVYNDFIDMNTIPESDNSGNYGSEWVDFDDDGDIDLFITKCMGGIDSPNDPLRLNVLYQNDGFNYFTEKAGAYGLRNGAQSWTGSFADLDNDGDLDCFVSNHDTSHVIYRNILNDTFVDVTSELIPAIQTASIQSALRDFDNNGYVDIYLSGNKDFMFWNLGADQWVTEENPFGEPDVFTFATGDLNDDGFLDLVTSYGQLNETGDYDDIVWINQTNSNHYLKISLMGNVSNRMGVGTKVKAFSELGIQTRDVKIGESYGTTNSANIHFGLGAVQQLDSLIVYWPSGIIDKYYEIPSDQHLLVQESNCISTFTDLILQGDEVLCAGESVQISFEPEVENYLWSTGETNQTIEVFDENNLRCIGVDSENCLHYSNIKKIWYQPDQTSKIRIEQGDKVNCPGTEVKLSSASASAYLWSTGETDQEISIDVSGSYSVVTQGNCESFESDPVSILFFEIDLPLIESDTIWFHEPGPLELNATGNNIFWYDAIDAQIPIAAGLFLTDSLFRDTSFYVADQMRHQAINQSVGMIDHVGSLFGSNTINSGLKFNCWDSLIIDSITVITDLPGFRTFELRQLNELDGSRELIYSKDIYLEKSKQQIELGFQVDPGLNYIMTTNPDSNQIHFGYNSPGLYRSNQGVTFPYSIEDLIDISTSLHGLGYYYYFFDWKLRPLGISCVSEKVPVVIILDTVANQQINSSLHSEIMVFPNPGDQINVLTSGFVENADLSFKLYDYFGSEILSKDFTRNLTIELDRIEEGLYLIVIENIKSGKRYTQKYIRKK